MISRELFLQEIAYIKWLDKKEHDLNRHIDEFMTYPEIIVENGKAKVAKEKCLGFRSEIYSNAKSHLVSLLSELIGDTDDPICGTILSSWVFEYDFGRDGCLEIDGQELKTANDIYDYFLEQDTPDTITNELLEKLVFEAQRRGFLCAIEKLDRLGRANRATKNRGWEDRNALIKFIRSQLITNYQFHTLDDELIPDRIVGLPLWKDLNNE